MSNLSLTLEERGQAKTDEGCKTRTELFFMVCLRNRLVTWVEAPARGVLRIMGPTPEFGPQPDLEEIPWS